MMICRRIECKIVGSWIKNFRFVQCNDLDNDGGCETNKFGFWEIGEDSLCTMQ